MHSLGHSIPLFLAFAWLLWPPFGVPLSSTSFQMKFFCFMEWCLTHFHPFPRACDPCMYGHPKPWKSLHHNPSFSKSKPQVRKLRSGTSLPYSPHFLSLSFSKPKNLWVRSLGLLFMLSGVRGATPRKCIDVPFSRNYVLTWVFDHIKSYNGGFEIQLVLDKCTGTITVFYLSSQNSDMMK
ncbi:hypothetical protein AAG906_003191 [Vitis piasezkii]